MLHRVNHRIGAELRRHAADGRRRAQDDIENCRKIGYL